MFVIVNFIAENSVALVPKKWLNTNKNGCFWPNVKKYELPTLIRKMKSPKPGWNEFAVSILSEASSFSEGMRKLKKAESESELTSDTESFGRGKRIKFSRYFPESESEEEDSISLLDVVSKLPTPPSFPSGIQDCSLRFSSLTCPSTPNLLNDLEDSQRSSQQVFVKESHPSPQVSAYPSTSGTSPSLLVNSSAPRLTADCSSRPALVNEERSINYAMKQSAACPSTSGISPSLLANFSASQLTAVESILKPVVTELVLMKSVIQKNNEILNSLLKNNSSGSIRDPSRSPSSKIDLPMSNLDDLLKTEGLLNDKNVAEDLTHRLRNVGGLSYADETRRIMKFVMEDEVAKEFNWNGSGTQGRKKFSNLMICRIVVDAVSQNNNISKSLVEGIIKSWLRHANERFNYVGKSKRFNPMQ